MIVDDELMLGTFEEQDWLVFWWQDDWSDSDGSDDHISVPPTEINDGDSTTASDGGGNQSESSSDGTWEDFWSEVLEERRVRPRR